jgi:hypothetical protein
MNKFACIAAIALCLNGAVSGAAEAADPRLGFNRDKAVFGIKEQELYAYVDLAGNARALQKMNAETLTKLVLDASVEAASGWWKAPRFSRLDTAVIDVITILNKDQYAKADFSSALMHGKVYLRRGRSA